MVLLYFRNIIVNGVDMVDIYGSSPYSVRLEIWPKGASEITCGNITAIAR